MISIRGYLFDEENEVNNLKNKKVLKAQKQNLLIFLLLMPMISKHTSNYLTVKKHSQVFEGIRIGKIFFSFALEL